MKTKRWLEEYQRTKMPAISTKKQFWIHGVTTDENKSKISEEDTKKINDELKKYSTPKLWKSDQEQITKFKKLATDNNSSITLKGKPLIDSPEYAGVKGSSPNPCWCCYRNICLKNNK